jgi:cell wall-associated NlpC family hydrolase
VPDLYAPGPRRIATVHRLRLRPPSRRHAPAALAALCGALTLAGSAVADPPSIVSKQAEAQRVLEQIHDIDLAVEQAAEAWNAANIELDRIEAEQLRNKRMLALARRNFGRAEKALEARLVTIYTSGESNGGTMEVLLGATSLDDLLDRLDTADRVSEQDASILAQVRAFRGEMKERKAALARAHERQRQVVAERAARRATIEAQLVARQRLLSSIRSEISRLQAAERARQARLAAQARARLAAQPPTATPVSAAQAPAQAPPSAESEPTAPAPAARYGGVVGIAMQYLGTPYRWGGAAPGGFDCSGFVMYVYAQVGVSLPHNAAAQYGYGSPVSRSDLQPGDLVFFNGLGHNGIYIGGGQFIHSPHTGDVVKISSLSQSWYASTWVGARRL